MCASRASRSRARNRNPSSGSGSRLAHQLRRRVTSAGGSQLLGRAQQREARQSAAEQSLPLTRDSGTDRNNPSSAGDTQASSGGERNQTITAVTQAQQHVPR